MIIIVLKFKYIVRKITQTFFKWTVLSNTAFFSLAQQVPIFRLIKICSVEDVPETSEELDSR